MVHERKTETPKKSNKNEETSLKSVETTSGTKGVICEVRNYTLSTDLVNLKLNKEDLLALYGSKLFLSEVAIP
jgi:hypothetical protein